MCYVINDEKLIGIEDKTKEFKYEFLKSYIPLWNKIICGKWRRDRAIVDTHAGTGKVLLNNEKINGSSAIFLEKTALKQELLNFYFIEKDINNYRELRKNVNEICRNGFEFPPKYKKKTEVIIRNGLPYEKKVEKYSPKLMIPNLEQIHVLNGDCGKLIGHVLKEIKDIPAFFFIDPCGKFEWKLIKRIIKMRMLDEIGNVKLDEEGKKIQGTELFINWSWEAILRNKTKDAIKHNFIREMFGMDYSEIQNQLRDIKRRKKRLGERYHEYHLYLEIYMNNLRKYIDYVTEMEIP